MGAFCVSQYLVPLDFRIQTPHRVGKTERLQLDHALLIGFPNFFDDGSLDAIAQFDLPLEGELSWTRRKEAIGVSPKDQYAIFLRISHVQKWIESGHQTTFLYSRAVIWKLSVPTTFGSSSKVFASQSMSPAVLIWQ